MMVLKTAFAKVCSTAMWQPVSSLISRVALLDEHREAKQIENIEKHLAAVAGTLKVLKASGASAEELRGLALSLQVPILQANLEAMLVARGLELRRRSSNAQLPPLPRPRSQTDAVIDSPDNSAPFRA